MPPSAELVWEPIAQNRKKNTSQHFNDKRVLPLLILPLSILPLKLSAIAYIGLYTFGLVDCKGESRNWRETCSNANIITRELHLWTNCVTKFVLVDYLAIWISEFINIPNWFVRKTCRLLHGTSLTFQCLTNVKLCSKYNEILFFLKIPNKPNCHLG